MIAQPPHNRKLGLVGVSLTAARPNKHDFKAAETVRDAIEGVVIDSGYLDGAHFSWVTLAIRYGLKNEEKPHYQAVSKKYGDLPLAIEIDTHEMMQASLHSLCLIFGRATLISLIHAGRKFERPVEALETALQNLSTLFPDEGVNT
jgi:hypothetical protein